MLRDSQKLGPTVLQQMSPMPGPSLGAPQITELTAKLSIAQPDHVLREGDHGLSNFPTANPTSSDFMDNELRAQFMSGFLNI